MAVIDIGSPAIDRSASYNWNSTSINIDNPANAGHTIDTVEIWADANMPSCKVGMLYLVSGSTYKCRSVESIGSVAAGSKQTFSSLSIDVEAGDYIGTWYSASGQIERDTSGFAGVRYISGDYLTVDTEVEYSSLAVDDTMSLYGTGVAVLYQLAGVTKDNDGNVKATSECFLCKDNLDNTASYIAYTQSDGSGNYSFTGLTNNDAQHFVISWKDETPHIFDVTDHELQPVEE